MCGIAGVLYAESGRSVSSSLLTDMGNAIAHRGPDGEGTFRAGPVGLVHRRLAIIDLEGGRQPLSNEDESIHVVFNGEIYNYQELRRRLESRGHVFRTNSDTEVLVHLYEDHGADLCTHLRGMFAFAIWDARRHELLLARDHLGQKPLFIYRDNEKLVFGSELKAVLAHPGIDRTIDPAAIEDFLTFGFIPGQRSIFGRVSKLPAAHRLRISCTEFRASPQRYWQLSFDHEDRSSVDEWKERIDSALHESVKAHLIADVPVGAFLSGGLDSSSVVAMMARVSSEPVRTFSIGFHEEDFSELPFAREVARHFDCHHTEEIVTPEAARDLDDLVFLYDEPFADASALPTMAVSRLAAQHVKVVLSGDGGDELFGGYARYSHDLKETQIRKCIPAMIRSLVLGPMAAIWPKADWLPRPLRLKTLLENLSRNPAQAYANTVSACRKAMRRSLLSHDFAASLQNHEPEQSIIQAFQHGHRDTLSGMLSADTNVLLPDDFLTKVDRASMGFGLEVRPPLIDWKLMELAASMPSEFKIRNGSKKWMLKQLFESRLPNNLVNRRKQGFEIPIDQWLRGPLRDQVRTHVLNPNGAIAGFINVTTARQLFESHCKGIGRHGQLIWSMLILARWLDAWGTPAISKPKILSIKT
ncbi:MAG: asparagine synthase (glutamine-hydrolyzing) [Planctomycetota bacterium]|nr:asparagine synthase (glutamine-hydrolyzing) [Planctomycetota bacterium]